MNQRSLIVLILFFFGTTALFGQDAAIFYTPPTMFLETKDLVKDFGADRELNEVDSKVLQAAIDTLAQAGGGRLLIPAGIYSFREVSLRSNVHLVFDPAAVIQPHQKGKSKNYCIFNIGRDFLVENISLTSSQTGETFTVDLRQVSNFNVAVFALRNVNNFLISDVLIQDEQSKFSSFTFGITPAGGGQYAFPQNGVVRNCTTTNADYGYGLVQVQAGQNILFENISGQGGVTLRLETGETKMNNLQQGGIHDVVGRNIACQDGNAAVMISPHAMQNGKVTINGVAAENCGFGVRIGQGFVSNKYDQNIGLRPGKFDPASSVSNVRAVFGRRAQVKPKHFMYIPLKYQTEKRTADTPITNVHCNPRARSGREAVYAVSVAAVGYFSGRDVLCQEGTKRTKKSATYSIRIDEQQVTAIGFTDQRPVIDMTDNVWSDCDYLN